MSLLFGDSQSCSQDLGLELELEGGAQLLLSQGALENMMGSDVDNLFGVTDADEGNSFINNSNSFGIASLGEGRNESDGFIGIEPAVLDGYSMANFAGNSKVVNYVRTVSTQSVAMAPMWNDVEERIMEHETVVMDDWSGPYGFKVAPNLDREHKKKVFFDIAHNKLFCSTGVTVPFRVDMDYKNNPSANNLMIRACLVYDDDDVRDVAVVRCQNHLAKEEIIFKDPDEVDRLPHMLRPSNGSTNARYFRSELSRRCYIIWPASLPEAGMTYVNKGFCFTCLNSCQIPGVEGKARRQISLQFVLFDGVTGEILGRSRTSVRICSAPGRDFKKETGSVSNSPDNRKRKSNELAVDVASVTSPKQCLMSPAVSNGTEMLEAAGPAILPLTVRNIVKASKQEDDMTSSQETVYSSEESEKRIHMREYVREVRYALKLKQSNDPVLRSYATHVFNSMRMTLELAQSARQHEASTSRQTKVDRSPDFGYHQD